MRKRRGTQTRDYRLVFYLAVAILAVGIFCFSFFFFRGRGSTPSVQDEALKRDPAIKTIMVMGIDPREGDKGRSDTLAVAFVDTANKSARLLSIPRDTRVKIAAHGFDKINHAYAYNNEKLTKKTVEDFLGVPMDYFVMVDVKAFERIIDELDGVDIDVEKRMYYEDPWDDDGGLVIDLEEGMQHLDGEDAMGYVRYRDDEGDIGRIRRQQKFLRAFLEKAVSPDILPKLPRIVQEMASLVTSDMSVSDMMHFAAFLPDIEEKGIEGDMLHGKPAWWDGTNYWIPDVMPIRETCYLLVGAEWNDEAKNKAAALATEYEGSLPKNLVDYNGTLIPSDEYSRSEEEKAGRGDNDEPGKRDGEDNKRGNRTIKSAGDINVRVLNSSGINGAGAEVAEILERKGFNVIHIGNGDTSDKEKTTISAPRNGSDFFYGMPFECVIFENEKGGDAVVNIGRDYGKLGNDEDDKKPKRDREDKEDKETRKD
ncbi:MAG: LCP family protein [Schwartzia sp.]|nr:LCP family protein [Schwartzia sp. (in: firmicutes)]